LVATLVTGHRWLHHQDEIRGVGYRVQLKATPSSSRLATAIRADRGPEGITSRWRRLQVSISGIDKQKAAESRRTSAACAPDPYKARAFRYEGEQIRRKVEDR